MWKQSLVVRAEASPGCCQQAARPSLGPGVRQQRAGASPSQPPEDGSCLNKQASEMEHSSSRGSLAIKRRLCKAVLGREGSWLFPSVLRDAWQHGYQDKLYGFSQSPEHSLCHWQFVPAHLTRTAVAFLWPGIFCFVWDSLCAAAFPTAALSPCWASDLFLCFLCNCEKKQQNWLVSY